MALSVLWVASCLYSVLGLQQQAAVCILGSGAVYFVMLHAGCLYFGSYEASCFICRLVLCIWLTMWLPVRASYVYIPVFFGYCFEAVVVAHDVVIVFNDY